MFLYSGKRSLICKNLIKFDTHCLLDLSILICSSFVNLVYFSLPKFANVILIVLLLLTVFVLVIILLLLFLIHLSNKLLYNSLIFLFSSSNNIILFCLILFSFSTSKMDSSFPFSLIICWSTYDLVSNNLAFLEDASDTFHSSFFILFA
jgi:hypothetical protein